MVFLSVGHLIPKKKGTGQKMKPSKIVFKKKSFDASTLCLLKAALLDFPRVEEVITILSKEKITVKIHYQIGMILRILVAEAKTEFEAFMVVVKKLEDFLRNQKLEKRRVAYLKKTRPDLF